MKMAQPDSVEYNEDLFFGDANIDFFGSAVVPFSAVNEHNYARMSDDYTSASSSSTSLQSTTSSSDNMSLLMTPAFPESTDDLSFVEDLIPLFDQPSSATHNETFQEDPNQSNNFCVAFPKSQFDPLQGVCSLVDKDTLVEALCLDIPLMPEENGDDHSGSIVSTMFDFISSTSFAAPKTSDKKSLLPLYASDSDESSLDQRELVRSRQNRQNVLQPDCDVVTDEERMLLAREGVILPVPENPDEPVALSEEQDKILKNIRRKQRNKESAKESRKRKADYIDCLEKRVKTESSVSNKLKTRVNELEQENEALSARLQYMQGFVQKLIGSMKKQPQPMQKSTCVFVMLFALCVVLAPRNGLFSLPSTSSASQDFVNSSPAAFNSAMAFSEGLGFEAENAIPDNRYLPQSFIFSYEASVTDRAADL